VIWVIASPLADKTASALTVTMIPLMVIPL
jgi:hypothetical protein